VRFITGMAASSTNATWSIHGPAGGGSSHGKTWLQQVSGDWYLLYDVF
jgi:hypothetical protein